MLIFLELSAVRYWWPDLVCSVLLAESHFLGLLAKQPQRQHSVVVEMLYVECSMCLLNQLW